MISRRNNPRFNRGRSADAAVSQSGGGPPPPLTDVTLSDGTTVVTLSDGTTHVTTSV